MGVEYIIKTPRIGLRTWQVGDMDPFFEMSQDEDVMKFFPHRPDRNECEVFIERMNQHQADHGHCYWAVDILKSGEFIGFIGLKYQDFESEFTPNVDIGWRLKKSVWGKGFAPEGAQKCLEYGLKTLSLDKIYSFCPKTNNNSERVMQKIGLRKIGEFVHPALDEESGLNPCLAYATVDQ